MSQGYRDAIEAAGFKVISYRSFGDYSGEFSAFVEDIDGSLGFITDSYGSCGGCDDYEREMEAYRKQQMTEEAANAAYGVRYRGATITYEAMISRAKKYDADLVSDDKMLEWVMSHEEEVKKHNWKVEFDQEIKGTFKKGSKKSKRKT